MPMYVMSDGRTFTDYNSACISNELIKKHYGITSNEDYKKFLQTQVIDSTPQPKGSYVYCPKCQKFFDIVPHGHPQ
jgi:hypothetical protein